MKVRYIGNFPPPYGGVTIKNRLLWEELSKRVDVACFEKPKCIPVRIYQALNMLLALVSRRPLVIGVSAAGGKSKLLTRLLYLFNRNTMRKSLYFMMGGTEAKRIAGSPREVTWYGNYREIYVETHSMEACLKTAGLRNVRFYPNCRKRPEQKAQIASNRDGQLKCVFFSLIQPMKGVDLILETAKALPGIAFTFWGHIDPKYEAAFLQEVEKIGNVQYLGVFRGTNPEVYAELSKHDVLLFPTKWKTEGVPGILAEAKIAGITAIASNESYNAELVSDHEDGLILNENTVQALISAINMLDDDRVYLERLKTGALCSAKDYFVERYIDEIIQSLEREE